MKERKRIPVVLQPSAEAAADLEIENHIEETVERLVESGWDPDAARFEAARRFGGRTAVRGAMVRETRQVERKARWWDFFAMLPFDIRHAARNLRANPLFTLVVIGTLGLGMGAAATSFVVVDALLLRPLPYAEPDRLADVVVPTADGGFMPIVTPARARLLSNGAAGLKSVAFYSNASVVRTGAGVPEELYVLGASGQLDETLGIRAHIGRMFDETDTQPGAHRAILSYEYWKKMGGNADAIGSTIRLDGIAHEVVGVLPRDMKFPVGGSAKQLWLALPSDYVLMGETLSYVNGIARLADDAALGTVSQRLAGLTSPVAGADASAESTGGGLGLMPFGEWRGNPELVRGVWLIAMATVLMLLVALANAINLTLFRGADRTRELAVRLALGISRLQLLRHIMVENLVVALLSGALAVLLTIGGVALVNDRLPSEFAFSSVYSFTVSPRVLSFTFIVACVTGFMLGLLPALRALRMRFVSGELVSARGATRRDQKLSYGLVMTEVAFAVALLCGAGLLVNSFSKLTSVDPGLDTDRLAAMSISLPATRYASTEERALFMNNLIMALRARPEVQSATMSNGLPPNVGFSLDVTLQAEGGEPLQRNPKEDPGLLPRIVATPEFLDVAGVTLLSGRNLTPADIGTENVLIDENVATALWGTTSVTGKRFRTGSEEPWQTVTGVYRHIRANGLDDRMMRFGVITPRNPARAGSFMTVLARATGDPATLLPIMREELKRLDPELPTSRLRTLRDAYSETVDKPRFMARVMTGIAFVSLVLAAVGVYGVLGYSVSRRRREIGIRLALGAAPRQLFAELLRNGILLTACGAVLGGIIGWWLVKFAKLLLYELEPTDPATLAVVTLIVFAVASLASLLPARVAGSISPASALRAE